MLQPTLRSVPVNTYNDPAH